MVILSKAKQEEHRHTQGSLSRQVPLLYRPRRHADCSVSIPKPRSLPASGSERRKVVRRTRFSGLVCSACPKPFTQYLGPVSWLLLSVSCLFSQLFQSFFTHFQLRSRL